MSRFSIGLNIVLAATVVILVGLLYRHSNGPAPIEVHSRAPIASSATEDRIGSGPDVSNAAIIDRLAALDARLAAMEHRAAAHQPGPPEGSDAKPTISPQDADLANRRLSSMFPASTYDDREMLRFHVAVARLPANEQIALLSAYTKAINEDRLKHRRM
jgi:hypothetical protein